MGCFVYDGVDLESRFEVAKVEIQAIPSISLDLREASGINGAAIAGKRLDPMEVAVTVRMATEYIDERDIQRVFAEEMAPLVTDEPKPLYLSDGRYHMAILHDSTVLEFGTYSATCELKFLCADPIAYGMERTVTVPSKGSVEFEVRGTWPAKPAISAPSAVRDGTALIWGICLDSNDHLHVLTGTSSAVAVEMDCPERTCTVAGATALPTLDSDWLELEPGTHTLANDYGTGAATVTYVERWL